MSMPGEVPVSPLPSPFPSLPPSSPSAYTLHVLHSSPSLLVVHKPAGLPLSGSKPITVRSLLPTLHPAETPPLPVLYPPRPVSGPVIFSLTSAPSCPTVVFTLYAVVVGLPQTSISDATVLHSSPIPSPAGTLSLLTLSSPHPGTGLRKALRKAGAPVLGDASLSGLPARGLYLAISRADFPDIGVVVDCPLPPKFTSLIERENKLEKRRRTREARSGRTRWDEKTGETKTRFLDWYFATGGTLTPRQSSECVAEAAAELLQRAFRKLLKSAEQSGTTVKGAVRLLDLGTGCGNLMISALLRAGVGAEGVGVDLSEGAVCVARRNVHDLGLAHVARVMLGDFARLEGVLEEMRCSFDVVVSNPPYLTRKEVDFENQLRGEPEMALVTDGEYGMEAYEAIARSIGRHPGILTENGCVVLEVGGTRSANKVRQAFENVASLRCLEIRIDERGFERCLMLRRYGT